MATWVENTPAEDPAQLYPILAHHWESAGQADKAVDYLEKSGEQALRNGAYREAAQFFRRALDLDPQADGEENAFRRAIWRRQLGEAYLGLGKLHKSREQLQQAISLLVCPVPSTRVHMAICLVRQLLLQLAHRMLPAGRRRRQRGSDREAPRSPEVARAYERLAEICYVTKHKG